MLRRSMLALSHRRLSIGRLPRPASAQISSFVCPRREFSSVPQQNASPGPGSTGKPTETGKSLSKVLVGSVVIGTCFYAAYSRGYLDDILGKKQRSSSDPLKVDNSSIEKSPKDDRGLYDPQNIKEPSSVHTGEDLKSLNSNVKDAKESIDRQSAVDSLGDSSKYEGESESIAKNSSNLTKEEYTHVKEEDSSKLSDDVHAEREQLSKSSSTGEATKDEAVSSENLFGDSKATTTTTTPGKDPAATGGSGKFEYRADMKTSGENAHLERHEADENPTKITEVGAIPQGNDTGKDQMGELQSQNEPKDILGDAQQPSTSLLDTYYLRDEIDDKASALSGRVIKHASVREETSSGALGDLSDAYVSKDGKLILDFLQAIHAAEQRQAELDAHVFAEEKRAMKEKYEKELKDARARELMYAEEAAMLEKEVKKERAKAAAALKSLQERADERLKMELEAKEREAESKLKEVQDFAKAELAASIAREKAAQIERMTEANLNINALCMAFYARSEEARQTHSIHKLALGALALEDALSNGLPVQAELDALHVCIENVDKDSLLQLALSSLPEDVRLHGTDNLLQLNQKFDALKGALRHFCLIPPDGGGILAHLLARVASLLKVKEADQSGDGIESVINKVETLLAQGKLVEAADALEDGVKGSKASEVVSDWLRRARNRAIAEQALVLLQSYATSVSLT